MSDALYLVLLAAVAGGRLGELALSRRNRRRLVARGAIKAREPRFRWMVALHGGVLLGAGLEVVLLHRPLIPALAVPMSLIFVLANLLRWWTILTLADHWNVQVMDSAALGVVSSGPYRWIRHPNYLAVALELFSLPLIHTAWLTAIAATLANAWVIRWRLAVEEPILLADPTYRAALGAKPRFVPRLFEPRAKARSAPQSDLGSKQTGIL